MITRTHIKDDAPSTAQYSDCERYRYALTRTWDAKGKRVLFVMLNPSQATEVQNDPTVERCERRARALGFGAFQVTNIFPALTVLENVLTPLVVQHGQSFSFIGSVQKRRDLAEEAERTEGEADARLLEVLALAHVHAGQGSEAIRLLRMLPERAIAAAFAH